MSKAGHVLSVLAMLVMLAGCGGGAVGPVKPGVAVTLCRDCCSDVLKVGVRGSRM